MEKSTSWVYPAVLEENTQFVYPLDSQNDQGKDMPKSELWTNDTEIEFFKEALEHFASPEQLFYKLSGGYFAYIPKGTDAEGQTLQSRNALIGQFTENWARNLLSPLTMKFELYAVNGVVCEELGLTRQSSADIAFCTKDSVEQRAQDVKLLFEVTSQEKTDIQKAEKFLSLIRN